MVDLDLEKFFDPENHDILMSRGSPDGSAICAYCVSSAASWKRGLLQQGVRVERYGRTPQGGPLTPPTMLHKVAPQGAVSNRKRVDPIAECVGTRILASWDVQRS